MKAKKSIKEKPYRSRYTHEVIIEFDAEYEFSDEKKRVAENDLYDVVEKYEPDADEMSICWNK